MFVAACAASARPTIDALAKGFSSSAMCVPLTSRHAQHPGAGTPLLANREGTTVSHRHLSLISQGGTHNHPRNTPHGQLKLILRRCCFEATPIPAWVYNTETLGFLASTTPRSSTTATPENSSSQTRSSTSGPPRKSRGAQRLVTAARQAHRSNGTLRHRHKDGELIDVRVAYGCIDYDGRRRDRRVNDVSERKRLEQQLATRRRWRRSAASPAASRTTSTTC